MILTIQIEPSSVVTYSGTSGSGIGGFAIIAGLMALASAILWIVIGWRAMRAHERIADAATEWVRQTRPPGVSNPGPTKSKPPVVAPKSPVPQLSKQRILHDSTEESGTTPK